MKSMPYGDDALYRLGRIPAIQFIVNSMFNFLTDTVVRISFPFKIKRLQFVMKEIPWSRLQKLASN